MSATLYGIGVGPGDPELITMKAHRLLSQAPVVAYPAPDTGDSFARAIVARYLSAQQVEVPIIVPMRVARFPARAIYDRAAATLAAHLDAGRDVVVLCEGDPFFYGSFMYLHERLAGRYPVEIVPGISSIMAGGAALGRPLAARNDVLSVIPAPLPDDRISAQIAMADAVAIIKLGRHFSRIRTLLETMNLTASSAYLERISLGRERIMPLASALEDTAPYFSMILIYKGGEGWAASADRETRT